MKRSCLAVAAVLLTAVSLHAEPVPVECQGQQTIEVNEATAAYSLNPAVADVSVSDGKLTVYGKAPGSANVVVVLRGDETQVINVSVFAPQVPDDASRPRTDGKGRGFAESRYSSQARELRNSLEFSTDSGGRVQRLRLIHRHSLDRREQKLVDAITSLSYDWMSPSRKITLFDKTIDGSRLTLDGVVVRGFHLRQGAWNVTAGYNTAPEFANLLFEQEPKPVLGLSYRKRINTSNALEHHLFHFDARSGQPETVGTLVHTFEPSAGFRLNSELAVGRRIGVATDLNYQTSKDQLRLQMTYRPRELPSLAMHDLSGTFSDLVWQREIDGRLTGDFSFSDHRYDLRTFEQHSLTSALNLRYTLTSRWHLFGGASYSLFELTKSGKAAVELLHLPMGIGFNVRRYGATLTYRPSKDLRAADLGSGLSLAVRGRFGRTSLSIFGDRQTQTPTVELIFAEVPGLELALQQLGLSANTPGDIARLLRTYPELIQLGLIEDVRLDSKPERLTAGANLLWGSAESQIHLNLIYRRSESVRQSSETVFQTLGWSSEIFQSVRLQMMLTTAMNRTVGGEWARHSSVDVSIRHDLSRKAHFRGFRREGNVSGVVFIDDRGEGSFEQGMRRLEGVEIILDGSLRARTDREGRYTFSNIKRGMHKISVVVSADKPFLFTTDSTRTVETGDQANFGVAFLPARLVGYVRNDAGNGIAGVQLVVSNDRQQVKAATDGLGKFSVSLAEGGIYEVAIDGGSVPTGYSLEKLERHSVQVTERAPAQVELALTALRSVAGRVIGGHAATKARVSIPELARETETDADGKFLFRSLPAGKFTVVVMQAGAQTRRELEMPAHPAAVHDFDLVMEKGS